MKKKVDLILPTYCPKAGWAEQIIEEVQPLRSAFEERGCELTLHLSNDGSPMQYFPDAELDKLRKALPGFTFHTYEHNRGKGACLRNAVSGANGEFILYTDTDLPFGKESVIRVLDALLAGADVAMGARSAEYSQALSPIRKLMSSGLRRMNLLLLGLPKKISDTQAGIKGFNRKGRAAFLHAAVETFLFDTEFILIAYKAKLNIVHVPVKIRDGLKLSRMGLKIMRRELWCFVKVLLKYRFVRRGELSL